MAKRYDPFPIDELPPEFAKVARIFSYNNINIAAFAAAMPTPSPEWIAEQITLFTNASAAWARLATWKKSRWSICALTTWEGTEYLQGITGYSGYTLYLKCWLEQKPDADKQPISPCSARVTDPFASPWNYQP
jgi:hypothetical protein